MASDLLQELINEIEVFRKEADEKKTGSAHLRTTVCSELAKKTGYFEKLEVLAESEQYHKLEDDVRCEVLRAICNDASCYPSDSAVYRECFQNHYGLPFTIANIQIQSPLVQLVILEDVVGFAEQTILYCNEAPEDFESRLKAVQDAAKQFHQSPVIKIEFSGKQWEPEEFIALLKLNINKVNALIENGTIKKNDVITLIDAGMFSASSMIPMLEIFSENFERKIAEVLRLIFQGKFKECTDSDYQMAYGKAHGIVCQQKKKDKRKKHDPLQSMAGVLEKLDRVDETAKTSFEKFRLSAEKKKKSHKLMLVAVLALLVAAGVIIGVFFYKKANTPITSVTLVDDEIILVANQTKVIDVRLPEETIVSVTVPSVTMERLAKDDVHLELRLSEATIQLDAPAVKAIAQQAAGADVTITAELTKAEELTFDASLPESTIVFLNLDVRTENGPITELNTNYANVRVSVELTDGTEYLVLHCAADGTWQNVPMWSHRDGELSVMMKGLYSFYITEPLPMVIVTPTPTPSPTPEVGLTDDADGTNGDTASPTPTPEVDLIGTDATDGTVTTDGGTATTDDTANGTAAQA